MNNKFDLVSNEMTSALANIELSNVNNAILAKVSDDLKDITAALMRCNQFSSGVSLQFCKLLYEVKADTAKLKRAGYKGFGEYAKTVLRIEPSQATRYSQMFERLFIDTDTVFEPFDTLAKINEYTVAQLVAISLVKDGLIRKLLINNCIKPEYSCTNINAAVKYLNSFDKMRIEDIKWNTVVELLEKGASTEKPETVETTATETAENVSRETELTKTENGETVKEITFTTVKEYSDWIKKNKDISINSISVTYIPSVNDK